MKKILCLFILYLLIHQIGLGQNTSLSDELILDNLDFPWEITWGPDENLWITQTTGSILKYDPKSGTKNTLITLDVAIDPNHGNPAAIGLFGLALHPEFPEEPYVYVMYNYDFQDDSVFTRISRLEYDHSNQILFNEDPFVENFRGYDKHSGGRMIITNDDKLLITTGDEFKRSFAQQIDKLNGKTLRFNLDGSVPEDNPFFELESPYHFIYSIGHRNPQGLVQVPKGTIFSSEHGPNSDDEINVIKSGSNYGWPFVKGFCDDNYPGTWNDNIAEGGESELAPYYGTTNHREDLYPYGYTDESDYCANFSIEEPVFSFLNERVAPSGLTYYGSDAIPEWKNSLLLATLRGQSIRLMKLNEDQTAIEATSTLFQNRFNRIRDVEVTPYGDIYVISSERENNNSNSMYRVFKTISDFSKADDLKTSYNESEVGIQLTWDLKLDYLSYLVVERSDGNTSQNIDTLMYYQDNYTDVNILNGQFYEYTINTYRKGQLLGSSNTAIFSRTDYPNILGTEVQKGELLAYPNPTSDKVFLNVSIPAQVSITDLSGKEIQSFPVFQSNEISLKGLKDGIYLIKVKTSSKTETMMIVKNN